MSQTASQTSLGRRFIEIITPVVVEGDSFHAFDRAAMKEAMAEAEKGGNRYFSHFGEQANLFDKLEEFTKYCGGMEKLEGVEKL